VPVQANGSPVEVAAEPVRLLDLHQGMDGTGVQLDLDVDAGLLFHPEVLVQPQARPGDRISGPDRFR